MYHHNPFLNLLIWLFTGFGAFAPHLKHARHRLTETNKNLLEAVAEQERLRHEIESLKLQLQNDKLSQKLQLERERASWSLELEQEKKRQIFDRDQLLKKDKYEAEEKIKRAELKIEETLKRAELKNEEILTMKKLDFEQRVKQAELDKERAILVIKEDYAKKESELHSKLHAEMYGKLNNALVDMSQQGDKNTRFVHDLMMKIFDKAPALNSFELTQRQYQGDVKKLPTEVEVTNA